MPSAHVLLFGRFSRRVYSCSVIRTVHAALCLRFVKRHTLQFEYDPSQFVISLKSRATAPESQKDAAAPPSREAAAPSEDARREHAIAAC